MSTENMHTGPSLSCPRNTALWNQTCFRSSSASVCFTLPVRIAFGLMTGFIKSHQKWGSIGKTSARLRAKWWGQENSSKARFRQRGHSVHLPIVSKSWRYCCCAGNRTHKPAKLFPSGKQSAPYPKIPASCMASRSGRSARLSSPKVVRNPSVVT